MRTATVFLFACLALSGCASQSGQPAELILHNGVIWTGDSRGSIAEATAIRDGRFIAVGSSASVLRLRGDGTRVIDFAGSLVVPGFNDNHTSAVHSRHLADRGAVGFA